ncbi:MULTISPECIES: hypothetical protein [Streptomyces]|uniref:hypothetical protein n=1 Tax=Streptomyces TaxID=1883 RepID=UPI0006F54480|nr:MULTISPECIES: hypothetical protein [Streptomyces]KQX94583.1 hypothetical protein ASD26_19140 [Streptomyces sp. Root1319]KQZ05454.1 hypothetical protein ASD51_13750 [Streptomyces sp. Root55]RPK73388.1 hypothetical protein EES45_31035 [Streptomyces sp. ADI97-07]WRY80696.1 hypothetical protein OG388_05450 [Streptomyces clavifer]WUC26477.1 hypothetical protein OG927_03475 [Streptomyces clavifer]
MHQVRTPRWAAVGPLDERTEGQAFGGAAPIAATQVIVTVAAAVVVAYAAGAIIGSTEEPSL